MKWLCALNMLALVFSLCGAKVHAHDPGMTAATLFVDSGKTVIELSIKALDAQNEGDLGLEIMAGGIPVQASFESHRDIIATYVLARTRLFSALGPCEPVDIGLDTVEDGLLAVIEYPCGLGQPGLRYATRLLHDLSPATVQSVLVMVDGEPHEAALDIARPDLELSEPPGFLQLWSIYFQSGMRHLFIGFDHLAFLVALMLWAERIWPVVRLVTAFTLAHSITLSLAALSIIELPPPLIEVMIALSVVYVAVENFFSRNLLRKAFPAFAFGLLHGFGFANVLGAQGLAGTSLVAALLAFNLGVESGQLLIVVAIMMALLFLDRLTTPFPARARRPVLPVYVLSALIALVGAAWFIERLVAMF